MEELISKEAVIIGKGNLGKKLCDILKETYPDIAIRDKWRFQKENEWHPMEFGIMHICFPYFDGFVEQVKKYQKQYNPKYTIIHSNVPAGISRKCDAIKFRNLGMEASIGGEQASEMLDYFTTVGFSIKVAPSQEAVEEMKPFVQKEGAEMLSNRREILTRFVKENNFKDFAEIGVYKGEVLMELAENCELNSIIGVDPNEFEETREWADNNNGLVNYIIKSSVEAAKDIPDESLDLVFIDGDHRYEAVKEDILAWMPKLRKGGIISGHDYDYPFFEGVTLAVDELLTDFNLELDADGEVPTVKVWWKKI